MQEGQEFELIVDPHTVLAGIEKIKQSALLVGDMRVVIVGICRDHDVAKPAAHLSGVNDVERGGADRAQFV